MAEQAGRLIPNVENRSSFLEGRRLGAPGAAFWPSLPHAVTLGMFRPSVCAGKDQGGSACLEYQDNWENEGADNNILLFQARKHFKCVCFQKIMLKSDSQGFSLTPVAQAKLLSVRMGRTIKISLSCLSYLSADAPAASLPDLWPCLGLVTRSSQGFHPGFIHQSWPWASHQSNINRSPGV